jgi:hypothetical protein
MRRCRASAYRTLDSSIGESKGLDIAALVPGIVGMGKFSYGSPRDEGYFSGVFHE